MQDFTNYTPNQSPQSSMARAALSSEAIFFQRIYGWMFAALAVTAGLAFVLSTSTTWLNLMLSGGVVFWVVGLAPLGLALYLSARIEHLSAGAIRMFLLAIAALFGGTLAVLFVIYPTAAFVKAFVCTAGIYGAMAAYGLVTKRSLQAWGSFLFMGVVGLILASIVNMFIKSGPMDFVICIIGVLVFAGLTAYDHQKLRVIHFQVEQQGGGAEMMNRFVMLGALTLYLDFINLFLFLLRIFGRGND